MLPEDSAESKEDGRTTPTISYFPPRWRQRTLISKLGVLSLGAPLRPLP
jgi:hypothetical protein